MCEDNRKSRGERAFEAGGIAGQYSGEGTGQNAAWKKQAEDRMAHTRGLGQTADVIGVRHLIEEEIRYHRNQIKELRSLFFALPVELPYATNRVLCDIMRKRQNARRLFG